MKFTVNRTELLAAAQNAERIAPRVSTIEILQCAYLQAEQDTLTVASGNLEIALEQQLPAQIDRDGSVVVKAPLLSGMLRLLDGERVTFQMKTESSLFRLETRNMPFPSWTRHNTRAWRFPARRQPCL